MRKSILVSCFILALLLCVTGCSEAALYTREIMDIFEDAEKEQLQVAEEHHEPEVEIITDEVAAYTPEPSAELFTDLGILPTEDETPQLTIDPTLALAAVPTSQITPEPTLIPTPEPMPALTPTITPEATPTPIPTPEPILGYINARSLNMRKGPTTDSDIDMLRKSV